jgi:hypothetical protein
VETGWSRAAAAASKTLFVSVTGAQPPPSNYRVPKNGHITTNAAVPRWQRDAWRARLARDPSKDQQLRLLLILTNVWHSLCVSPWREAIAMVRAQIASRPADSHAEFAGRPTGSLLEIDAWIRSEVNAISPLAERLMRLIEGSHCITGEEHAVELALREALSNAVVHGNRLDAHKIVHVRLPLQDREGDLVDRLRPGSRL